MNFTFPTDWRVTAVLSSATVLTIFAVKMDGNAAERVSIHLIDALRDVAIAIAGNR